MFCKVIRNLDRSKSDFKDFIQWGKDFWCLRGTTPGYLKFILPFVETTPLPYKHFVSLYCDVMNYMPHFYSLQPANGKLNGIKCFLVESQSDFCMLGTCS